jgi:hypothetical protein
LLLIIQRRRFLGLPPGIQWAMALVAFSVNACLVIYALLTH